MEVTMPKGEEKPISVGPILTLRHAKPADCYQYWLWVNDPAVRQASFHSSRVPWEEHERWFKAKLNEPDCMLLLGFNSADECVGQIRFDTLLGSGTEVDISVDPACRGRGYGVALLRAGLAVLRERSETGTVQAHVKTDNLASIATFKAAGFTSAPPDRDGSVRFIFGNLR